MSKRKGNGPFGNPHPEALEKLACEICKKPDPTFWHRDLGALCAKCYRKFKTESFGR
jgi:hypothetical protein